MDIIRTEPTYSIATRTCSRALTWLEMVDLSLESAADRPADRGGAGDVIWGVAEQGTGWGFYP